MSRADFFGAQNGGRARCFRASRAAGFPAKIGTAAAPKKARAMHAESARVVSSRRTATRVPEYAKAVTPQPRGAPHLREKMPRAARAKSGPLHARLIRHRVQCIDYSRKISDAGFLCARIGRVRARTKRGAGARRRTARNAKAASRSARGMPLERVRRARGTHRRRADGACARRFLSTHEHAIGPLGRSNPGRFARPKIGLAAASRARAKRPKKTAGEEESACRGAHSADFSDVRCALHRSPKLFIAR
jgi:hypothetical protein